MPPFPKIRRRMRKGARCALTCVPSGARAARPLELPPHRQIWRFRKACRRVQYGQHDFPTRIVRTSRPRSCFMKRPLKLLIEEKRRWHYQPTEEERTAGFQGWRSRGYLPHFDAPGVRQFVTYRLGDALPAARRAEWAPLLHLDDEREKFRRIEAYLDSGHGECLLRHPEIASIVQENLLHFDDQRYLLLAWCLMPNHVHVVVEVGPVPLVKLLHTWKSYTSKRVGERLGRMGSLWQPEYFDRYARDDDHLNRIIAYVENNPVKAGLCSAPPEWPWSSARWRDEYGRLRHPLRSADGSSARTKETPTIEEK